MFLLSVRSRFYNLHVWFFLYNCTLATPTHNTPRGLAGGGGGWKQLFIMAVASTGGGEGGGVSDEKREDEEEKMVAVWSLAFIALAR